MGALRRPTRSNKHLGSANPPMLCPATPPALSVPSLDPDYHAIIGIVFASLFFRIYYYQPIIIINLFMPYTRVPGLARTLPPVFMAFRSVSWRQGLDMQGLNMESQDVGSLVEAPALGSGLLRGSRQAGVVVLQAAQLMPELAGFGAPGLQGSLGPVQGCCIPVGSRCQALLYPQWRV